MHREATKAFWPWIIVIAVAVAVLFAPILWLPGTSEARAAARAREYHDALFGLRQELAETQQALLVLTEPSAEPDALGETVPALVRLEDWGRHAREIADDSLPRAWPLAPSEPFGPLAPARDALAVAAGTAESTVEDLVGVLNYRVAFDEILVVDSLPLLPPLNFRRFKGTLSDLDSAQLALLAELPRPVLLRSHASKVRDAVGRFDEWIDEYVDALWIGDTPTAAALLGELTDTRSRLENELAAELSAIRVTVDSRILVLADELDTALAALEASFVDGGS